MATLNYINENKGFAYEDGSYKTTGQKFIENANFKRVDGGNVQKNDVFVASFNYAVENGEIRNLWVNFNDPSDYANVMAQINACFAALNEENE